MIRLFCLWLLVVGTSISDAAEVSEAIATIRGASPTSASSDQLRTAWKTLAAADASDIPAILRGMGDSNPAVENWLRTAADAVADRTLEQSGTLPSAELVELLNDTSAAPRGRRTAYEMLNRVDADRAYELLLGMMNDPSVELRYDSVAANLKAVEKLEGDAKRKLLTRILNSSRDLEQTKECIDKLEDLGVAIDLAAHMGFVKNWRLCGEFDNTDEAGFDVAYPPEQQIDFTATYEGKTELAGWKDGSFTTEDELAKLDLNDLVGPVKGAIIYAYSQVDSPKEQSVQVRYSSANATKLWVNSQLVASNEVYHAGGAVDQYVAEVELKPGKNTLLLKVCQNEQTQPWAQDWDFQLRLSDELGGAIEFTPVKQ